MYQLNLSKKEYELMEELVCHAYNQSVTKSKIVEIGNMLKTVSTIPIPDELKAEMDEAIDDFSIKFDLITAIHDRIHDLQPVNRADENNAINQLKPIPDIIDLDNGNVLFMPIDSTKDNTALNLYEADRSKLMQVFGCLSSYHTMLNISPLNNKDYTERNKSAKDARDYIWTLIDSIK